MDYSSLYPNLNAPQITNLEKEIANHEKEIDDLKEQISKLQDDLGKIYDWSKKWSSGRTKNTTKQQKH